MAETVAREAPLTGPRRVFAGLEWGGTVGITLTVIVVATAVVGPVVAPQDPSVQHLASRLAPPVFDGGTSTHWLGTDSLGRDIFSRVLFGARPSLLVGVSAVLLGAVVGIPLGLVTGYYRGVPDRVIMRLGDVQLAFPAVLLALALLAVTGPSPVNLVLVLALSLWVVFARMVRGEVLSLRDREFVYAAVALGAGDPRILLRHVLPAVANSVIVLASISLTRVILAEAALSFFGFGIQPPTPTWGGMISDGRAYVEVAWWVSTIPGAALTVTVMGLTLLGDYIRDRLDPRLRAEGG